MAKDLRVGVVGARRGSAFLSVFQAIPEAQVVGVCDLRPEVAESTARRFNVEHWFTHYEDLLALGLDLVVVATPIPLHALQAVQAMEAGAHVLSEVPAAVDFTQCWELVQAVYRTGKKYMMGENYLFTRPNVLVKTLVEKGFFGVPYFGEGEYIHELKGLLEETPWRKEWITRGCTYPTHSLGPLLWWMQDRVARVSCFGSGHHYQDPQGRYYQCDDTTTMICQLESGGLVNIRMDILSNRPHKLDYFSLQGTKGCYEAPRGFGDDHKIWLADFHSNPNEWHSLWEFEDYLPHFWKDPPEAVRQAGHGGGDYFEVQAFVDAILNDAPPPIDLFFALDMTVPGLVSQASILRESEPLPVPDFRKISLFPEDLPSVLRESPLLKIYQE